MRALLELLRIIFLLVIFVVVCGFILNEIYSLSKVLEPYVWLGGIGIYVLFFIIYRNKLQFSGWYKGNGRNKLPKIVTKSLIVASIVLLVSPYVLSFILS